MTDVTALMTYVGRRAKSSARQLSVSSTDANNRDLFSLADRLLAAADAVYAANRRDVEKARVEGLAPAFLDRLTVTETVLKQMAQGCRDIAALADPVGEISDIRPQPSGIRVGKMRVPLGVVGIIYEARPHVTVDAAALALKSGNAAILRGGSEAEETNRLLGKLVSDSLADAGLPADAVQVAPTTDRTFVGALITADRYVDVIIPRGGKGLIARLEKEASVPMIRHLDGICHTYVDKDADLTMAVTVCDNAKTQRYAPCNAMETLLVHKAVADDFLPRIGALYAEKHVEMRGDRRAEAILAKAGLPVVKAIDADWDTEYNAPVISIAVVDTLEDAIEHIETHGSHHTDAIITDSRRASDTFLRAVDSGSVMVNCSTRLADGFVYGLGAEIGISTGKLHARGPVGLEGLTNLKYIVLGNGECRH